MKLSLTIQSNFCILAY